MDWHAVLPEDVATRQRQWERRQAMIRMRALGFTYEAVGRRFGVIRERVRQVLDKERRLLMHPALRGRRASLSPAECWLAETVDFRRLAAMQRGPGDAGDGRATEYRAAASGCRHWCFDEKRCRGLTPWSVPPPECRCRQAARPPAAQTIPPSRATFSSSRE